MTPPFATTSSITNPLGGYLMTGVSGALGAFSATLTESANVPRIAVSA